MIGASFLFAGMGLAVKVASRELPNASVVFFRNAVALAVLTPWAFRLGWSGLRTRFLREHLVRSLFGVASMYCFFLALARLPLAEAVLLNYSVPLFMPVVERFWLGERLPPGLWRPLLLGFAGITLVLQPGPGLFRPAALVAVASALLASVAQVGIRRLTATEPPERIVFYFALISTAVSAVPEALAWRTPPRALWPVLLALGLLATAAQLLLTRAYAHAPAGRVGPFIYSSVLFAGALDWTFTGVVPHPLSLGGAALVIAAGVMALKSRER
ncbi:MAG TPA: DMT family transporter, partial [Vicinamibacteria bacterium]|nr:DMT family transporter [Vicinamibacteria bacterium]